MLNACPSVAERRRVKRVNIKVKDNSLELGTSNPATYSPLTTHNSRLTTHDNRTKTSILKWIAYSQIVNNILLSPGPAAEMNIIEPGILFPRFS